MKLDKVVVRTIVNTLCAIAVLCVSAVLFASLIFPSTMMGISYKLGDNSGAMRYAYTAYSRTGEVAYIAYATDVAFGVDSDEDIAHYGELFMENENFELYCEEVDQNSELEAGEYEKYVCGRVVVSIYRLGDKEKAYDYALGSLDENSFSENNAMVALLVETMVKKDFGTAEKIVSEMRKRLPTLSDDEVTYSLSLLNLYEKTLTEKTN